MLMPSIFGEDLFDDWMRLPVERETNRGYRTTELMKTDIKDVDGNYELSMDLPGFHKEDVKIQIWILKSRSFSSHLTPSTWQPLPRWHCSMQAVRS